MIFLADRAQMGYNLASFALQRIFRRERFVFFILSCYVP